MIEKLKFKDPLKKQKVRSKDWKERDKNSLNCIVKDSNKNFK